MKKLIIILLCYGMQVTVYSQTRTKTSAVTTPRTDTKTTQPLATPQVKSNTQSGSRSTNTGAMQKTTAEISGKYDYVTSLRDGTKIREVIDVNPEKAVTDSRIKTSVFSNVKKINKPNGLNKTEENNTTTAREICTTEEYRLSASNISEFTVNYSAQAANIYPGALYSVEDFYRGRWKSDYSDRLPINLLSSVKNTGSESPGLTIDNPDANSIAKGINTLFNRFTSDPAKISSEGMVYKMYEVENEASLALKMGASGNYLMFNASAMFGQSEKKKYRYLLIDATKAMFTISASPVGNSVINSQRSDLLYIKNVTYGARILAVAKIETYQSSVSAKFGGGAQFLVAGGELNIENASSQFSSVTEINYYIVGGRSEQVYTVNNFNDLKKVCEGVTKTLNYHVSQPISYTLANMRNQEVKRYSATDYFVAQNCTLQSVDAPAPPSVVSVGISAIQTTADNNDAELYGEIWVQAFDGSGKEISPKYNMDRLMSIKENVHLTAQQLHTYNYSPGKTVIFQLSPEQAAGAKIKVFYWLMEYNAVGSNDYLHMQNGYTQKPARDNNAHYVSEIMVADIQGNFGGKTVQSDFTADGEGIFTIRIVLNKSN